MKTKVIGVACAVMLGACASTGNVNEIQLKKSDLPLSAADNSGKLSSGIAIRYPVGFVSSENPDLDTAELYKQFNEALEFNRFALPDGWSKKNKSIEGSRDSISTDMDSRNFAISSTLNKTQLLAHALFANIKKSHPGSNVYLSPVLLDIEPKASTEEQFCDEKKISFMSYGAFGPSKTDEIKDYKFCYRIIDGSEQSNPPPPGLVIDTYAVNNPNLTKYWNGKERSMGFEITPAISISKYDGNKFSTPANDESFHNYYTAFDGTQRAVGEGHPFKCMFVRCKKKLGNIKSDVLLISDDKTEIRWKNLLEKTEVVANYAYNIANSVSGSENHLLQIKTADFVSMPALQLVDNKPELAGDALRVEYMFLSKNSDKLHDNFLKNGLSRISEIAKLEEPILQDVLQETKKANTKTIAGGLLGIAAGTAVGLNGSGAFTQQMMMNSMINSSNQAALSTLQKNTFKVTEELVEAQGYVGDVNIEYRSDFFSIGAVRSLEDLRAKVLEKVR